MISLIPLLTNEEVKEVYKKDKLYLSVAGIKDIYLWMPDLTNYLWFKVQKDNITIGIFFIKQFSDNCLCFHGGLYKEFRGKNTSNYLKECLNIIRGNTSIRFVTTQRKENKLARKVIENLGFELKTIIPKGYVDGDLYLYGEAN